VVEGARAAPQRVAGRSGASGASHPSISNFTLRRTFMKTLYAILLTFILAVAGCSGDKVNLSSLKPAATRTVGKLTIVLLNKSGELMQGQNEFVVQFKDEQDQAADVGDVQIGSSMSMPSMAPMSGDSELTPTGQTGVYKVTSNFAMSGAWHFTLSWNGPYGQGHTTFNSNVR
jgi:hypothetical protein